MQELALHAEEAVERRTEQRRRPGAGRNHDLAGMDRAGRGLDAHPVAILRDRQDLGSGADRGAERGRTGEPARECSVPGGT